MAYVYGNPKSKADLKRRLAAGEKLEVYQPGGAFPLNVGPDGGSVSLEGPHYPKAHTWYARVQVDGNHIITKIIG